MESLEQIAVRLGFHRLLARLDDLASLVPDAGSPLVAELGHLSDGFGQTSRQCPRTIMLLQAAWSNSEPQYAVLLLQDTLDRAHALASQVRRAGAAAVSTAQLLTATVRVALTSARSRIPQIGALDANDLVVAGILGAAADLSALSLVPGATAAIRERLQPMVFELQQQVLVELEAVVDSAIDEWDTAMRTLIQQLDVDFLGLARGLGVLGGQPCAPPVALTTPTRIDTDLRLALAADRNSIDPQVRAFAASTQQALDQAATAAGESYLLVYDPRVPPPQGALAIGVGNLEAAGHLLLMVGGIGTGPATVPGAIDGATAILRAANAKDPQELSAAIVYAGYDAPFGAGVTTAANLQVELSAMVNTDYATAQGEVMQQQLTPILNSLPNGTNVTAFLHSFGTTVGAAALSAGMPVDQIIFSGSPGVGVSQASALPINPALQFVMANNADPVVNQDELLTAGQSFLSVFNPAAGLGRLPDVLGPNPATPEFGAQLIDQNNDLPITQAHQTPAYLTAAGLANVAAILTERFDEVPIVGQD